MTLDTVAILIASLSAIIALASLVYAIKQRQVIKSEIKKKRYLENAQTNLTKAIDHLRSIILPDLTDSNCDLYESLGDDYNDVSVIINQILYAGLESKRTKFTLEVSYELTDYGELHSEKREERIINDFSQWNPKLLADTLIDLFKRDTTFSIKSETVIPDYERRVVNEISFRVFTWELEQLRLAIDKLTNYEEVYETVCPDIIKTATRIFEEISKEIFNVISEPKKVEVDLAKFSKVDDIIRYLFETYLNYNHISEKFSKGISELDSKLTEARKQLFLRISP
jgi:hypothetical protein